MKSLNFLLPWKHVLTFQIRWLHSIMIKLSPVSDKWVCIREEEGRKAHNLREWDSPVEDGRKPEWPSLTALTHFTVHSWTEVASIHLFIQHLTIIYWMAVLCAEHSTRQWIYVDKKTTEPSKWGSLPPGQEVPLVNRNQWLQSSKISQTSVIQPPFFKLQKFLLQTYEQSFSLFLLD